MSSDPDYTLEAGLPCNVDAEKTILGSILLDENTYFDDCLINIKADDFSLDSHRRIYLRMAEIMDGQVEAHHLDIVTLSNQLRKNGEIEAIGGAVDEPDFVRRSAICSQNNRIRVLHRTC